MTADAPTGPLSLLDPDRPAALYIGGEWRAPRTSTRLPVHDPATGELLARVADADARDVDHAVAAARAALPGWAGLDALDRGRHLRALAASIGARMDDLAVLEMRVTGRPIREMRAQMARIPEWLEYFAGIAAGLEGEANRVRGDFLSYTQYEPHGVCALLTPWNHPVLILVKKLAAALAAGNTVVVKPSELAPLSPLLIGAWASEAGLPPGVVNVVTGAGACGAAVCEHPGVARIDLTGGTATGRRVAASAGERLIPCTLELGGKAPVLIFEDVDLDEAVAGALFAGFVATGQTCVSGSRFLVAHQCYEAFAAALAGRAEALRVGDPAKPATQMGSLISASARDRCLAHVRRARDQGARLLAGGEIPTDLPGHCRNGAFLRPTVFADVDPAMDLFREEVFGPVVALIPFDDEVHALRLANDSEFALGASIGVHRH